MAVSTGLTAALKKVVLDLEDDLRDRVASQPDVLATWKQEHKAAESRERTAMSWQEWRDDRVTQAAVAWVLTTVFVRFCEDNRLLKPVWIAGPADRRQEALDAELAYFRAHPEDTDREWVLQAVEYLRSTEATRDLVESHSPLWTVSPSGQAAKRLIAFWRERTADGDLVWDLADPDLSTRFLGDLYQDLSDYAKKTFALLQTPEFVEEFILDQTMEPALAERPLEGFRLIDPTCGSGHFLLGAFARLNDRWAAHAPGMEVQARVQEALDAIHGVDLNPFAVAIARFRLMLAALQAADLKSLEQAPAFRFHLAAGDSLLHGRPQLALELPGVEDYDAGLSGFAYSSEDLAALRAILEPDKYDVVVGNPPYITVKDKTLNDGYRKRYETCKGKYALTVPFMERFFQLARSGNSDHPAGWAGQITSNSFMKREFGSRLIEDFLSRQDLRLLVDTSGAFIPGHGTPTVILVGRRQPPRSSTVKSVLGVRGEPGQPEDPKKGAVWTSIVSNIGKNEFENEYVSVTQLPRSTLVTHPWSLSGGGAGGLLELLNKAAGRLGERTYRIGVFGIQGSDDAMMVTPAYARAHRLELAYTGRLVVGDGVRDYSLAQTVPVWFPYDNEHKLGLPLGCEAWMRHLWRSRTELGNRATFTKGTYFSDGRPWYEWHQLPKDRGASSLSIAFSFVATHNHFVLDRGGKVFKQSAPVIKLPEGATEDDHLALLGVLNSSTACFWLKQNSHDKGIRGEGGGFTSSDWERFYEFTGTTLKDFPLPRTSPLARARLLDEAAQKSADLFSSLADEGSMPSDSAISNIAAELDELRARMISEQEELDWEVYRSYGVIADDLTLPEGVSPGIRPGERAFEIALAQKVIRDGESAEWFTRHGSEPVSEIPAHWPQAYRDLVQRRLDLIESNKFINLLERPEYKRRWATEPWEKRVEKALRAWLLDRLEARSYWFDAQGRPTARSVAQLSDIVTRDADLVSVLQLWDGRKDRSVTQQLSALLDAESVPFLAAYRLKDSGLRKREAWEHTWELQRREDEGEKVGEIPVPPKYTSADFRKQSWWQHRGKLDVPKERFILYPDAGRETDPTQLLGWAGWDHAQQALALNAVIAEREAEGWADDKLVPLVAGLAELQPWVRQWHDETDSTYQLNLADYLEEQLRGRAHQVGMTVEQLGAWRPPAASRGRRPRS
ncbi:BREX-2 system adenine-specific DNA-methyltransferase PglX [Micromonospora sp. WMMD718]|uniref:BREX-2 system adenine-specific DNA-methyltransferase PglX n=1 Tax=unclassified Micromonospora TaxID=2617518 RepID=UPI00064C2A4B|nr:MULTISPECIES: BREX-2 system adenine-specific DNA-methyltransferase PglX [unclassified Micromonospora]MDG4752823.1 BREX-2 system adenine-specific DNA-methyltransferase PglX [Micromonospora sp. WMMD718]